MDRRRRYEKCRRVRPPLYGVWMSMRRNCGIVKGATPYQRSLYEGISICPEWLDYSSFEKFAFDSGWQKGLYLTRRNKNEDFRPDNCFWCSLEEANGFRRCVRRLPDGRSARDIMGRNNLGKSGDTDKCAALASRLFCQKWDVEKAMTSPKLRVPVVNQGVDDDLYVKWMHMRNLCINKCGLPANELEAYANVNMCKSWAASFKAFSKWCIDNGWKKGMWLMRKDSDGDFCPSNCTIVTREAFYELKGISATTGKKKKKGSRQ